jgi:lysophospholipase L1-like esterase
MLPAKFQSKGATILGAVSRALVILLGFFLLCELALRLNNYLTPQQYNSEFVPDPLLFWKLRSNLHTRSHVQGADFELIVNSKGLRSPELPFYKVPKEYRVLCLGDSITYGHGVDYSYCYPQQLKDLLQGAYADRKISVINGGCPGYSLWQGMQLYKSLGSKYRPDLVILGFIYADTGYEWKSDSQRALHNPFLRFLMPLLYKSELYLFLRNTKISLENPEGLPPEDFEFKTQRVPLSEYRALLTEFARLVNAAGGKVIFLNLAKSSPDPFDFYAQYRASLKEIAEGTHNYYIDMDELFTARRSENLFLDRIHPNAQGFTLMAQAIFNLIKENKLVQ